MGAIKFKRLKVTKKNPTDFDRLQSDWYKKLSDSGFKDIESDSEKVYGWVLKQKATVDPEKQQHFEECGVFFTKFWSDVEKNKWKQSDKIPKEYRRLFMNPLNQFIFDMYIQGVSTRAIASQLPSNGFESLQFVSVYRRINKILKDAGIESIELTK